MNIRDLFRIIRERNPLLWQPREERLGMEVTEEHVSTFIAIAGELIPKVRGYSGFVVDNFNQDVVRKLTAYSLGSMKGSDTTQPLDVVKGLYLYGRVGTGKTILLETVKLFTALYSTLDTFRIREASAVAREVLETGVSSWSDQQGLTKSVGYDDLGNEPLKIVRYGTQVMPMAMEICARYGTWQKNGVRTHFTSNFDLKWIEENYGKREASRLSDMCNIIELKSERDRRK